MPTRIVNVHPGSANRNDQIQIVVEFDPPAGGGTPDVATVVFAVGADAPQYNVIDRDSDNSTLTLRIKVPATAVTGPIEVDLRAPAGSRTDYDPVRTEESFTVQDSDDAFRITTVFPATPAGGFNHGDQLRIITYPALNHGSTVYFPTTAYGPPILRPPAPPLLQGNTITVKIPDQAKTGRVKVVNGQGPQSALTRLLEIRSE